MGHGGEFFRNTKTYLFSRLECVDMTGRPVFTLPLSASITPRASDGGIAAFFAEMEALAPTNGSLQAILRGLGGFRVIHIFDKGFL